MPRRRPGSRIRPGGGYIFAVPHPQPQNQIVIIESEIINPPSPSPPPLRDTCKFFQLRERNGSIRRDRYSPSKIPVS